MKKLILLLALVIIIVPLVDGAGRTKTFYSTFGDGWISKSYQNLFGGTDCWNVTVDFATGDAFNYTYTQATAGGSVASGRPSPTCTISRIFLYFGGGEPKGAKLEEANLRFYTVSKQNTDNDGTDYIMPVRSTQAGGLSLGLGDYDEVQDTPLANKTDITNINTSQYTTIILNPTGTLELENMIGNGMKLALREGHDMEKQAIVTGLVNTIDIRTADYTGITYDPRLQIDDYSYPQVS